MEDTFTLGDIAAELWDYYKPFVQISSISALYYLYFRRKWIKNRLKINSKKRFEESLLNEIKLSNKKVDSKCVLTSAKVTRIENDLKSLVNNCQKLQQEFSTNHRTDQEKIMCLGREIADIRDLSLSSSGTTRRRKSIENHDRGDSNNSVDLFSSSDDMQFTPKTKILIENNISCTPRNLEEMKK